MRGVVQPIRGGPSMQSSTYGQQAQSIGLSSGQGFEEVVNVPNNLSEFASKPQFQQILLKVKQQTSINYIDLKRDKVTQTVVSLTINAPTAETGTNARRLVETHFKNHIKIMSAEAKLAKTQTELFSAQGEVASGMMVDFFVPIPVIGLVIGKGGGRIKEIEKGTGVSSINVDGNTGKIMVVGPDASSVQSARELLELQEEAFPLTKSQADWLAADRINNSLSEIRSDNNLNAARVDRDAATLTVIGTVPAIQSMRAMLSVQLEYIDKAIEIQSTERLAREQLRDFKREHGLRHSERDYDYRRERRNDAPAPPRKRNTAEKDTASARDNNKKPPAAPAPAEKLGKAKSAGKKEQSISITGLPTVSNDTTSGTADKTKKGKTTDSKGGKKQSAPAPSPAPAPAPAPAPGDKADKVKSAPARKDKGETQKDKVQPSTETPAPSTDPKDSKRRRSNKKEGKKEDVVEAADKADKPKADKPKADKPKADKADKADKAPKADKPKADKPKADKPKADKPKADKPKADKPKADTSTAPADAAGKGSATEDATKSNNKKERRGRGGKKDKADGDAQVEVVAARAADMSLQEKAKDDTKKGKRGATEDKDGGEKASAHAAGAKESKSAVAGAADSAAPNVEGAGGKKKTASRTKKGDKQGKDDHQVLDIAPLGKREKKERGGAKKDHEATPEVTTASA